MRIGCCPGLPRDAHAGQRARRVPVPCCTTAIIIFVTFAAVVGDTGVANELRGDTLAALRCAPIWRTMYGRGSTPPSAMVAPINAIRSGVISSAP